MYRMFICISNTFYPFSVYSGVVIVGAALCVAIGVPIALEMQSQHMNGFRHDLVRKLLSEQILVDG